jgi:hypothetical protein
VRRDDKRASAGFRHSQLIRLRIDRKSYIAVRQISDAPGRHDMFTFKTLNMPRPGLSLFSEEP